jgi:hypothetical protein
MSWNPNSSKHKATHGGYRKKVTKEQAKATFDFFDLRGLDATEFHLILGTPGTGKPRLGTQLKMDL